MQFGAKSRYLRYSPFKLRLLVDVVRGKNVQDALNWLATCSIKRAMPIRKMIESAAANAKSLHNVERIDLVIKKIYIDHGPSRRYYKPGAMGRSNIYRRRSSHASVILESIDKKEE